jgi:hypothetical protein
METPGVSVRPIRLISGKSPFCETIFDDVRVPVENVLGQINGGWTVAKALLGYERSMIADAFGASSAAPRRRRAGSGSRLVQLARQYGFGDKGSSTTRCCATRSRSSRWTSARSTSPCSAAATRRRRAPARARRARCSRSTPPS